MFDIKEMAGDVIGDKIDDLTGGLSIDKLFNNDFIKNNTTFSSITELVTKFKPDFKPEDIMSLIGNVDFDSFIGKFTNFSNFTEMLSKAKEFLGK
ncbi:hypothetical protein [Oceanivirga salmonicida]|uniref:hypothetical protein n=1 Tax=Oceanivirga salmonicida TaxID=1769291 RepID=UPI000836757A|nr:hypothetical protein [Oceanivirga salmonicida]